MEQITVFKSSNGKFYETREECEKADMEYESLYAKKHFVNKIEMLGSLILKDGGRQPLNIKCGDYPLSIRKWSAKDKSDRIHIDAEIEGKWVPFVWTTYEEVQVGFCDDSLRDYLDEFFWNKKEEWFKEMRELFNRKVTIEAKKIDEIISSAFDGKE